MAHVLDIDIGLLIVLKAFSSEKFLLPRADGEFDPFIEFKSTSMGYESDQDVESTSHSISRISFS